MANRVSEPPEGDLGLIAGHFSIDFNRSLTTLGGGQPAFPAESARTGPGFMAVQTEMGWPARARALTVLDGAPVPHLAVPLGHGPVTMPSGEVGYFVICPAPPGRPLSAELRPWPEQDLLDMLVRPAALALVELHSRDITHRAIRLNNVFRAGASDPVTLGCAWAAPPASRQPAIYEAPYSAVCLPVGRGEGARGDDIYALGVLMVILALGRDPMAGINEAEISRLKVEQGSFAAIVGKNRLPTAVAELARGMLAEDPEHRPSAVLLGDPSAARARRAAAKTQWRGQRAFPLGEPQAWTARELALAVMVHPDQAIAQLRNGAISMWLRRSIGDAVMASRMDEMCALRDTAAYADEPRADALLVMRAVSVLDPLAPLCWRRMMLWPGGLGAALNLALHEDPAQVTALTEIASAEVPVAFAALRPERSDIAALRNEARVARGCLSVKPAEQGTLRLNYTLNPLAPCESPLLAGRWVTKLADILPAMELAAAGPMRAKLPPMDRFIAAFIGVRRDERGQADLGQLANVVTAADPMSQLRLLARLQQHTHPGTLPALTAWLAEVVNPATVKFHSQVRRTKLAERLAELGQGGMLPPLVTLLDDQARQTEDRNGHDAAIARGSQIDAELQAIEETIMPRHLAATKVAQDVTSGISLAACGLALAAAAFL